ncbi:prepilin-type N-terminal cleavage/methylation domain-containing protein [Hydrogenophaga sp.]|uniref:prepilin-type N-terminal cleavage/methylation domain-containing protein n=2 Tax=Hydrogenophaga sp. TaxID=1904254 RepID=UPI00261D2AD0|nr:prepilin-type N-terminal cleavage/methylation domain-containing protein [Hydrogenophaga sp.]
MKTRPQSTRRQRGFTLVEMSVTMAAAGLLFAAVTTGQELIDQAKATKLINDVKSVEMRVQQFAQLKGRMPGDCDADGVIDYAADGNVASNSNRADTANNERANQYSYSVLQPVIPADSAEATLETNACALVGDGTASTGALTVATSDSNANVWLNDLKVAGVVSDSAPNRTLAKMVNEDFLFVGNVEDNGTESATGAVYNAIVIHDVPQWMARRLSTAFNGQDARADRSRVRLLARDSAANAGDYSPLWQTLQVGATTSSATVATRDSMVTVVYFFDRVPESQQQGI